MSRFDTFHALACLPRASAARYFEPHRENVLVCPAEVLARLCDESALRLRRRADDLAHDARLRRRAGEELGALEGHVRGEVTYLYGRLAEAERLLTGLGPAEGAGGAGPDSAGPSRASSPAPRPPPEPDAEAGERDGAARLDGGPHRVWVAACDPPLTFGVDFRGEFVETLYNVSPHWTFSFGSWYYRLKRLLYHQARWRRTYRLTQIDSLSISQELLLGVLNAVEQLSVNPAHDAALTDLEAAACLLAAYRAGGDPRGPPAADSVEAVLLDGARPLRALADDVAAEVAAGAGADLFGFRDPPGLRFYAPAQAGRRYAPGTFDAHAVVAALFRRGALCQLPGSSLGRPQEAVERVAGVARDDALALWTRRLLGDRFVQPAAVPNFVQEQQYLRAGVTAVVALLLLWRLVNSESVFAGGRAGRFSLRDVFPDGAEGTEGGGADGDGVGGGDAAGGVEADFAADRVRNFEFLLERYVVPWYRRDPSVTLSQLFPGLFLLAYCESHRSGWDLTRRALNPGDGAAAAGFFPVQSARENPLIDYMLAQSLRTGDRDAARLAAHDFALFHCEHGFSRLLSLSLPKRRVLGVAGQAFNAQTVYDLLYFFVLGFLPVVHAA